MNRKGFTLIELLAVIVILAVVAIIAVPLTLKIIDNAKKSALEDSAYGLLEAGKNYYALHSKDMDGSYLDFTIIDGQQVSAQKLSYKGKVDNAYVRLINAETIAVCVDDNKYVAIKNIDDKKVTVSEGVCQEYDDEAGFMAIESGTRLSIKGYASSSALPSNAGDGSIGIITDKKVTDYYLSKNAPSEPEDGLVWIVIKEDSTQTVRTKNSEIGIGYIVQWDNNEWKLKESYIYDNGWQQLTNYGGSVYEWNYDATGHYEEFTAPFSGYYTIELWGAAGGDYNTTYVGGNGAYTKGDIYLQTGEKLYIYVGGEGTKSSGWNNGATNNTNYGRGGGGATDIRTVPTSSATAYNETESLRTRIMVAAAGGGGEYYSATQYAKGGAGGGLTGYNADGSQPAECGKGATQIAAGVGGGSNSSYTGAFGKGGAGHASYDSSGGSGWYGGGGGSDTGGGAGGSSYISGHKGCLSVDASLHTFGSYNSYTGKYFVNTVMIDGEGYSWTDRKANYTGMPSYVDGTTMKSNDGPGHARIKFKNFASLSSEEYANLGADIQNEWLYNYMGYYQVFVAPKAGTYQFELWGAGGGDYSASYPGGGGAYTKGELTLSKGETLYIYVGSKGTTSSGWNNGATNNANYGRGGGGATDIRITPTTTINTYNEIASLKSRIMVAAAGGGGEYYGSTQYAKGGAAGGLTGYDPIGSQPAESGKGATQIAGGAGGNGNASYTGSFGKGGAGHASYDSSGGSGWYGGGGGSDTGGGAGGSSYISGHNGCIGMNIDTTMKTDDSVSYTGYAFSNTTMIDGNGYKWTDTKGDLIKMPTTDGSTLITGNASNGFAKITYLHN